MAWLVRRRLAFSTHLLVVHAVPPSATATSRSVEADACWRTIRESFHRHHWSSSPFFKRSRLIAYGDEPFQEMAGSNTAEKPHSVYCSSRPDGERFFQIRSTLQLLSDRGSEFDSALFSELCQWMCIEEIRTIAYLPSTNGMVERYHRTLNSISVREIIREDQRNWREKMPIAAAAYRASVHEATGYSANRLMLNREVYAPIDLVAGLPPGDPEHYESADDFVVQQRMTRDVYASVREHLQVAASRHKLYYDIRMKDGDFQPVMRVWYYYPRRFPRKSRKWQKTYIGPFLIVSVLPLSNAVLQKVQGQFIVPPTLRQAQSLPWHGTSRLAAYDNNNSRRFGRRQHLC